MLVLYVYVFIYCVMHMLYAVYLNPMSKLNLGGNELGLIDRVQPSLFSMQQHGSQSARVVRVNYRLDSCVLITSDLELVRCIPMWSTWRMHIDSGECPKLYEYRRQ